MAHRDFAAAEVDFRQAIQADPTFAPAHRELGMALWAQGHDQAAWDALSLAAKLDPGDADTHYALGQIAWGLQQQPRAGSGQSPNLTADDYQALALSETQKAVALRPDDFNMQLDLAQMSLAAGRQKEAQTQAEQAVQLAASPGQKSLAHVALARALLATDDKDRAGVEFEKAIQENPKSGEAYIGLGQILLFQHKNAEAIKDFRQAIQLSPNLAPAYAALAQLLESERRPTEARALYEKAVALNPEDWQSQYELAVLLMKAGQSGRANTLLAGIVAHRPDFLPAREQLALMLLRRGDVNGAIEQAQALVADDPQAVEGHRVLALAYWRERKTELSLAECAQALAADSHSTSMLALQALELWQDKRRDDARTALREAARTEPQIISPVTFCQIIVCDGPDIPLVTEFLRSNRWVINSPGSP